MPWLLIIAAIVGGYLYFDRTDPRAIENAKTSVSEKADEVVADVNNSVEEVKDTLKQDVRNVAGKFQGTKAAQDARLAVAIDNCNEAAKAGYILSSVRVTDRGGSYREVFDRKGNHVSDCKVKR